MYMWHVVKPLFCPDVLSSRVLTETSINDLQIIEGIDTISKVRLPHASSFPQQTGARFSLCLTLSTNALFKCPL
jgi:hypothetical protein